MLDSVIDTALDIQFKVTSEEYVDLDAFARDFKPIMQVGNQVSPRVLKAIVRAMKEKEKKPTKEPSGLKPVKQTAPLVGPQSINEPLIPQ